MASLTVWMAWADSFTVSTVYPNLANISSSPHGSTPGMPATSCPEVTALRSSRSSNPKTSISIKLPVTLSPPRTPMSNGPLITMIYPAFPVLSTRSPARLTRITTPCRHPPLIPQARPHPGHPNPAKAQRRGGAARCRQGLKTVMQQQCLWFPGGTRCQPWRTSSSTEVNDNLVWNIICASYRFISLILLSSLFMSSLLNASSVFSSSSKVQCN